MSAILRRSLFLLTLFASPASLAAPPIENIEGAETAVHVAQSERLACIEYADLLVTLQDNVKDSMTQMYATKRVKTGCDAGADHGAKLVDDDESYFFGKFGRYIFLDSGTGPPPRGLVIFDLELSKSRLAAMYDEPIEIREGVLSFWEPVKTVPTNDNCPELTKIQAESFTPVLERQVKINLRGDKLERSDGTVLRCQATQ